MIRTLAGAGRSGTEPFQVVEFVAQALSVQLPDRVCARIAAERGCGLLLGRVKTGGRTELRIEGIARSEFQDLGKAASELRTLQVLGYYRAGASPADLGEAESRLFPDIFPEPWQIATITGAGSGACYLRGNPGLRSEFEVRTQAPETRLPSFLEAGAAAPARRGPAWWGWPVQGPLLAALVLADGFMGYSTALHARPERQGQPAIAVMGDPYALKLMVVEYGDNLHLNWDRTAAPIVSAQGGTLSIYDGGENRTLELSSAQLRAGSVIYRRMSPQVKFRLEVLLRDRRSVSETWEAK